MLRSLLALLLLFAFVPPSLALAEPTVELLAMGPAPDRAKQCADKTRRAIDEHVQQAVSAIADQVEMPWIWREIRRMAESRLPSHQRDEFRVVLGPAVVSSGFDTVVGVGLGGHY